MRHLVFLMHDAKEYDNAIKEASKKKYKSALIQLFTSICDTTLLEETLTRLQRDFPKCEIVGATTAGEIAHAKMYENNAVISLSLFESSRIETTYTPSITSQSGIEAADAICNEETKALILLSEGLHGEDYEGFIQGIKKHHPDVLVAGGLAGDGFKLQRTFVIHGNRLYEQGCVAVSFSAKELYADNRYNLNWYSVGKEFTITKADGKAIEEIDGQKALELFKKYLGPHIFEHDISSLPDFQFLYKDGSTVISRTPMRIEDDKIIFAAPIKQGQRVRFGFSNAAAVISGANEIASKMQSKPAEAIYIFSCIARKILLGEVLENEFKAFESVTPTAGFFTYGEFYSTSDDNALLNCTTTILTLSENHSHTKKRSQTRQNYTRTQDNLTFKALTNFIEQTSTELSSNIHLLQQYKELVDKAFLVVKIDTNGNITYINDNFCKVSHCDKYQGTIRREELIKIDRNILTEIRQTLKNDRIWRGQLRGITIGDKRFFIDTTIMPIFNERLEVEEYIAIGQDISQQLEAKEKLRAKNRFIQAIFDNQESILISTSKARGLITVNKKFFEYFDFSDYEDFKRRHDCICELFIQEEGYINMRDNPDWLDLIAENPNIDFKVKMHTRLGERIFRIKINLIESEYIINLDDITSLENAIEQAHKSERSKSAFLASMSHEIRTPLNGIIGFAELLKKEVSDPNGQKYADIIHKSSQMLLHIVNDILDYSKIESGEMQLHIESCNLKEELKTSALTFASLTENKHINYTVNIDPDIPEYLYCDSQRIKQIVNNLLGNAVKFTPKHGSITFDVSLANEQDEKVTLLFNVQDSGIGISKEKQRHIFKPFSQADDSIDKKYGGTGLGLAISSQFLSLMGSSIQLQSKEGIGSRFYFRLELAKAKAPKQLHTDIPKQFDALSDKRVLIVEDNKTNRLLLSIMLQKRNIPFDAAEHGEEALQKIDKNDYALVFMDINMPVLDGLSTIRKLRKQGFAKPIVSLSANVMECDIENFLRAGADDYLHKPILPEKLDAVLARYLTTPKETPVSHSKSKADGELLEKFKKVFELLDEESIKNLLISFVESADELIEKLQKEPLDYKTAHTIKGLAANFHFTQLADIAAKAESIAKNTPSHSLKSHKEKLLRELNTVTSRLKKELSQ